MPLTRSKATALKQAIADLVSAERQDQALITARFHNARLHPGAEQDARDRLRDARTRLEFAIAQALFSEETP